VLQVKNEPIPSTNANWPTLEEERELHWNKQGWFDPRFSRRWDVLADKEQKHPEAPAKKDVVIPQPAAAEDKQASPAPETQQAAGDKGAHALAQATPAAPELEQQKVEQQPSAEKPSTPKAAKPVSAEPSQQAVADAPQAAEPKQQVLSEPVKSPNAAAPKTKFADLFKDDHKEASKGTSKAGQAANNIKAVEGQNKPIEEPKVSGQEQQKAAEASKSVQTAPEQAAAVVSKNGTDTPSTDLPTNGTDAPTNGTTGVPQTAATEPTPAKEEPKQPLERSNTLDDGVRWPSLEEEREAVANQAGWFDPRYSRRWNGVRTASIPEVLQAVFEFSEEAHS
jgi:hypothetical protein